MNMKKLLIGLLSLMVAGNTFAESDIDSGLKEFGIVDDNYVYTDLDLASSFFTTVTDVYAKSLPINFNRYMDIDYRPLVNVTINSAACISAFAQ